MTDPSRKMRCPVWGYTLWNITAEGIDHRCKHCKGAIHHTSWAELDRIRAELAMARESETPAEKQAS